MSDLVVIDASVLLAIALPDPQANKDYAMALLSAIDKGDVSPILTQLCHHDGGLQVGAKGSRASDQCS